MASVRVGCVMRSLYASLGSKAERVPTNNQRGRGSGPFRLWGGLDKARHIVPTALLVRVQCFRKYLYKAVKGPSTRPIFLSMIVGRLRRFTIFGPNKMKFANSLRLWPSLVCRQDDRRRPGEWFLSEHIVETIFSTFGQKFRVWP